MAFSSQPVVLLLPQEICLSHVHEALGSVSGFLPDKWLDLTVSICAYYRSNAFEAVSGLTTDRWLCVMISCLFTSTKLGKYCNGCCCREMAATFDIGKLEGRDRFPNLEKACQHTIECIQVSYFSSFHTVVCSSTVNFALQTEQVQNLLHFYSGVLVPPCSSPWSNFHVLNLISFDFLLAPSCL